MAASLLLRRQQHLLRPSLHSTAFASSKSRGLTVGVAGGPSWFSPSLPRFSAPAGGGCSASTRMRSSCVSDKRSIHHMKQPHHRCGSLFLDEDGRYGYKNGFWQQQQQRRHYWFIPTSWTELKLRMQQQAEKRTIQVRLFLEQRKGRKRLGENSSYSREAAKAWVKGRGVRMNREYQYQRRRLEEASRMQANRLGAWIQAGRRRQLQFFNHKRPLLFAASSNRFSFLLKSRRSSSLRKNNNQRQKTRLLLPAALYLARTVKTPAPAWRKRAAASLAHLQYYYRQKKTVTLTEYSEADWFDPLTGRPLTSKDATGRFVNPWMSQSTNGVLSLSILLDWQWRRIQREWKEFWTSICSGSSIETTSNADTLQRDDDEAAATTTVTDEPSVVSSPSTNDSILTPDFDVSSLPPHHVRLTWIGHCTCLLQQQLMDPRSSPDEDDDESGTASSNSNNTVSILTDPMFSDRASPWSRAAAPWVGIQRLVPPACTVDDLPPVIDVCIVSHDHYDHLDKTSVRQLSDRVACWVVPVGLADWLQEKADIAADRIVELQWWESVQLQRWQHESLSSVGVETTASSGDPDNSENKDKGTLVSVPPPLWKVAQTRSLADHPHRHPIWYNENAPSAEERVLPQDEEDEAREEGTPTTMWVTCFPAQHWSGRTLLDRNYRLWGSFACFLPQQKRRRQHQKQQRDGTDDTTAAPDKNDPFLFYFGGDTAYPTNGFPLFNQIRDYLDQPVDLAALPIGAYAPAQLCHDAHMNPAEAIRVHQALESRASVGIHWGSFPLSEEPLNEPPQWLAQEIKRMAQPKQQKSSSTVTSSRSINFGTLQHGQSLTVPMKSSKAPASSIVSGYARVNDEDYQVEDDDDDDDDLQASSSAGA